MNDRPTAVELLGAVRRFLEREVVPALEGPRRYHARVAANVVGVVAREIEVEEQQLGAEWERLGRLLGREEPPPASPASRDALRSSVRAGTEEIARRIRAGEADSGPWRDALIVHLRATVADKLDVARPPRSD